MLLAFIYQVKSGWITPDILTKTENGKYNIIDGES